MLYGDPSSPAHRATHLGRQNLGQESTPTPQHRQAPPPRRVIPEPQHTMQLLMSGLGAVIMLAICGLSGFFIIADERRGHGAEAAGRPAGASRTTGSKALDATPLTLEEVFPATEVRPVLGAAPYAIGMTHIDADCAIAAVGSLGAVLKDNSCSQVVRAVLTAPYGGYQVTAGIFNLADEHGAAQVGEQARQLVESGDGTFAAMASSGPSTRPLVQVGWRELGHYLAYCVIARPDGQLVRDDDPYARRITVDLVKSYLGEQVVGKRSTSAGM
jgi:hypothetical protein